MFQGSKLQITRGRFHVVCRHGQKQHLHRHPGSVRRLRTPAPVKVDLRKNPCRDYLLSSLRLRDPVVDTLLSVYPSLAALSLTEVKSIVDPNMALLRDLAPSEQITKLVCTKPKLLAMPLSSWYQFLSTYGLSDSQVCMSVFALLPASNASAAQSSLSPRRFALLAFSPSFLSHFCLPCDSICVSPTLTPPPLPLPYWLLTIPSQYLPHCHAFLSLPLVPSLPYVLPPSLPPHWGSSSLAMQRSSSVLCVLASL